MKKMLDSGDLRHRIAIQERLEDQDSDTGDIVYEWATVEGWDSVPAKVEPLSAREFLAASSTQTKVVARITIRYRAGLTSKQRVVYRGQFYNIAGVLNDADSGLEYITLPVTEGGDAG